MSGLIWENDGILSFIIMTVILGGGAAWATGRAVAGTWRSRQVMVFYIALLTVALRFIHFALFAGTLLSVQFYLVNFVILLFFAEIGFRKERARQMATQYRWMYRKAGPLGWRANKV